MRNQRSNFIPVPTKPAKNAPKPLPRGLGQRKSSSSQTDRVVLVKEENLTFFPCTRLGQNDGGMRRDYVKAINYINSCHKFINTIAEKNADNKNNMFLLPMVTNFTPIFPYLIGKKAAVKTKDKIVEEVKKIPQPKTEERKSKSSFGVRKVQEEPPVDPLPVGDCGKNVQQSQEDKYAHQVADIVKEQVHQFLSSLQEDMNKAMRKTKSETPKQKCKNLDIVKQRLEELSKICFLQKKMESNPHLIQEIKPQPLPSPLKTIINSEDCSVILSDTDNEEIKQTTDSRPIIINDYDESVSSLISESSDIKSDSDLEINL